MSGILFFRALMFVVLLCSIASLSPPRATNVILMSCLVVLCEIAFHLGRRP